MLSLTNFSLPTQTPAVYHTSVIFTNDNVAVTKPTHPITNVNTTFIANTLTPNKSDPHGTTANTPKNTPLITKVYQRAFFRIAVRYITDPGRIFGGRRGARYQNQATTLPPLLPADVADIIAAR